VALAELRRPVPVELGVRASGEMVLGSTDHVGGMVIAPGRQSLPRR
jgi:hypothetical protein